MPWRKRGPAQTRVLGSNVRSGKSNETVRLRAVAGPRPEPASERFNGRCREMSCGSLLLRSMTSSDCDPSPRIAMSLYPGYGGIALGIPYIAWDMVGLFIFVIVHEVLRCPLLLDHIECRLHHWSRVLLLAALRTD